MNHPNETISKAKWLIRGVRAWNAIRKEMRKSATALTNPVPGKAFAVSVLPIT